MAIVDDFSVAANGNIRYTGSTANYTVLELHRFLQDLADDASSSGDDLLDITDTNPSSRSTDQIVTLNSPYNIDDTASEHLYAGSIEQDDGDTLYAGLKVIGSTNSGSTELQIVQNNALVTSFWSTGINTADGDLLRILVKVRASAADIDGKRVRVQAREFGDTFSEFTATLGEGEGVAAITTLSDDFNQTASGTIATYTDITNTEGYQTIDLGNGNGAQPYYSQWDIGSRTTNDLYERGKYIQRRGTAETIHGVNGSLFRGITHSFAYDTEASGPFSENETLSWGTGTTAGTGLLLALDDDGTTGNMYIQLLTGVAPTDNATITGGTSSATCDVNGTVTERPVPSTFLGNFTGNLSGAYGIGVESADLTSSDALRDLLNVAQTPPNNVTASISGLAISDYILLGRDDGTGSIDLAEYTIAAGNTSGNGTLVINQTISSDTPASGFVRAEDPASPGKFDRYAYTSYTGSTFSLSGTLSSTYTSGDDVFVPLLDQVADATTESATLIYSSDFDLVGKVRNGGTDSSSNQITHIIDYDAESGGPYTVGETLTFSGGSTGILRVLTDGGTTGTIEVDMGTDDAPADNETFIGGTSSATGAVNGTPAVARIVEAPITGSITSSGFSATINRVADA